MRSLVLRAFLRDRRRGASACVARDIGNRACRCAIVLFALAQSTSVAAPNTADSAADSEGGTAYRCKQGDVTVFTQFPCATNAEAVPLKEPAGRMDGLSPAERDAIAELAHTRSGPMVVSIPFEASVDVDHSTRPATRKSGRHASASKARAKKSATDGGHAKTKRKKKKPHGA